MPGTIAAGMTTRVATRKDSIIHGENFFTTNTVKKQLHMKSLLRLNYFLCRCFVGEMPDQWRNCSDRYFPVSTTPFPSTPYSGSTSVVTTVTSPSNNKYQVVRPHKNKFNKKGSASGIYQSPPRPGLGQESEDFAAARLWPITYLYKDGPPNSTEISISNFVDCKKESDC